jgi:N-acetylglucosaminyl-diphospho-decaprenol L-rhamnosyltransferase
MSLTIAIVNYNSRELMTACLQSIAQARISVKHEVVVVDNHSSDGSVEAIRNLFPFVRLLENKHNLGFSRAVNLVFHRTSRKYCLVLNPDIEVSRDSVEQLVNYMESHPEVGLCAPKLLNPDGTMQYSCRRYYTMLSVLLRRTTLGSIFPNHEALRKHLMMDWDHSTDREVDWVLGAAFMLRREAIPDSQVMDERFFLYFEDVDLCLRLQKAGWKVIYYPGAVMIHHHQRESAKRILSRAKFEHMKSWIKFSWKHRHEPLLHLSRNKGHG